MFGGSVDFFLKPILGDQTQKKQSMVNLEDEKAGPENDALVQMIEKPGPFSGDLQVPC